MKKINFLIDNQLFGVCTKLAEKFGWSIDKVRLFFIYMNFVTLGSSSLLYLFLALGIEMRKLLRQKLRSLRPN
ncbi:MAG: PspC domain-containing protein [Cytophagales bacterium]|nr:PspC domain-containing protein [Cytophagales bacterium]